MADLTLNVNNRWDEAIADMGDGVYARTWARAASLVDPAAQATVDAWAPVAGSVLDALHCGSVAYTILNTHGVNGLNWKVVAANDAAFVAAVEVQASALVAATASGSYAVGAAPWRYYRVEVQSAVAATPATALVVGLAKA